jgi:hypothetical protein
MQKRCLSPLMLEIDSRFMIKNYLKNSRKLHFGKNLLQNIGIGTWNWAS